MTLRDIVTIAALVLSGLSFALYVAEAVQAMRDKTAASIKNAAAKASLALGDVPTVADLTRLLDAISRATDSLAKAGPSLTSLIASVLFLAIAAVSSGALRG
jgi:hypothetical protein